MPMFDQPGKDPEGGEQLSRLRKLYDDVIPSGRVILTVTDKDLKEHHALVPIPRSHEAAIAIVTDQLGKHLNKPGSFLEGGYFQCLARSSGGDVIWAKLAPEFWKEIVRDGDQLKLSFPPFATFTYSTRFGRSGQKELVVALPKTYEEALRVALANFDPHGVKKRLDPRVTLTVTKYGSQPSEWQGLLDKDNWMERVASADVPVEIDIMEW